MGYNFLLQRAWTFNGRGSAVLNQAFLFLTVNLLGLVLSTAIVYLLVELLDAWYLAAQAVASVVIALLSFFAYRWIFARAPVPRPAAGEPRKCHRSNLAN